APSPSRKPPVVPDAPRYTPSRHAHLPLRVLAPWAPTTLAPGRTDAGFPAAALRDHALTPGRPRAGTRPARRTIRVSRTWPAGPIRRYRAISRRTSAAASTVVATSASECAVERKSASKRDGAK